MDKPFSQQLREEFDIPGPIAVWIVLTHFFVLACPLVVIWAIDVYANLMPQAFANTTLIQIASAVYIGATAFEVAQNSADRWYLTEATRSVADLFFNSFMTLAFCLYTIGFVDNVWMATVSIVLTALFPIAYIADHPSHRALNGVVVMLACVALFMVTRDPTVFLFMVGNALGVYFILFLVKRREQWLHGWAAFFFGLGFLSWPWAIVNAANGETKSWLTVVGITAFIVVVAGALGPMLGKTTATPRPYSSG